MTLPWYVEFNISEPLVFFIRFVSFLRLPLTSLLRTIFLQVTFCMTLNDGEEIRQYLTAYLGTDASVNNFATEFINRKSGKSQQDEWESATTKKNKKKKGVTK